MSLLTRFGFDRLKRHELTWLGPPCCSAPLPASAACGLGVHYPTDVLGGWMIGFVWASICWLATERFETQAGIDAERDKP